MITLREGFTFERPDPMSLTVRVADPDGDWDLDFTSSQPLAAGTYLKAERAGFASDGRPGLAITGHGHACNEVRGQFAITSLPTSKGGTLAITFTQLCGDVPAALTGTVQLRIP